MSITEHDTEIETIVEAPKQYGSRDSFLARSGKLTEAEVEIDGEVWLVRELPGSARNMALAVLGGGRLQTPPVFRLDEYQRVLLLHGLVDSGSPEGARKPLLQKADLETAMGLGAAVLDPLVERIEQLSALSEDVEKAREAAKAFLADTPSGPSTSG